AGHVEHVAQHPQERGVAVDVDSVVGTVNLEGEGHGHLRTVGLPGHVTSAAAGHETVNPVRRRTGRPYAYPGRAIFNELARCGICVLNSSPRAPDGSDDSVS